MSLFNLLVSKTIMHVPGPIVSYFAKGYIAGNNLSDAVRVSGHPWRVHHDQGPG
jgi:proline dehydrogenase